MADDKGQNTSGSETRKRDKLLQIRVTESELAEISAAADDALLTVPSYARQQLLELPPPRARRRPSVEIEEVARVLAELGKIGSNLNQIAKQMNAGLPIQPASLERALSEITDMREACLAAMGRKAS